MGQPNPPSPANMPLVQGVDPQWNPILQHIPEDKRAEVIPHLTGYDTKYSELEKNYEPWKDVAGSGLKPDQVTQAVTVLDALEHRPQEVYEILGRHLGITPQQAQQAVETGQITDPNNPTAPPEFLEHPEFKKLKQQADTMAQLLLANKTATDQERQQQEQDQALETEMATLKGKVGDFPEDEILMRMGYREMTAEEAFNDWQKSADGIRSRRPSPYVLGSGGLVPRPPVDVTKLDGKGTKDLVAQMLAESQRDQ